MKPLKKHHWANNFFQMEKIFNDPYADGLHQTVMEFCRDYPTSIHNYVLSLPSVRSAFEAYYQVLVSKKEIEPLENQSEHFKERIWEQTKNIQNRKERIKAFKSLYLIEKILK